MRFNEEKARRYMQREDLYGTIITILGDQPTTELVVNAITPLLSVKVEEAKKQEGERILKYIKDNILWTDEMSKTLGIAPSGNKAFIMWQALQEEGEG